MSFKLAIWVILGGGIGSLLRFWLSTKIPFHANEFAWATFLVNMAGCFAIGCCFPWFHDPFTRAFLVAGILGGFTTFSGFSLEILRYIELQQWKLTILYAGFSLILGTVLVWFGFKTGSWLQ
ncbi:MAG: CrcB family protein [Bacteroidetes bacterium]|nr:CrcB family protein [Bacteroidota bacterium]